MSSEWTDRECAARERAVRERVEREFTTEIEAVGEAADAVAAQWDEDRTTDRTAVVDALDARLRESGIAESLVGVAAFAADVFDTRLPADPVARPPYFVVTGEGPMVRASLDEPSVRVVVLLRVFRVHSDGHGAVYRRTDGVACEVTVQPTD